MFYNSWLTRNLALLLTISLGLGGGVQQSSLGSIPEQQVGEERLVKRATASEADAYVLELGSLDLAGAVTEAIHEGRAYTFDGELGFSQDSETAAYRRLTNGHHPVYEVSAFEEEQQAELEKAGLEIQILAEPDQRELERIHARTATESEASEAETGRVHAGERTAARATDSEVSAASESLGDLEAESGERSSAASESASSAERAARAQQPEERDNPAEALGAYRATGRERISFLIRNHSEEAQNLVLGLNGERIGRVLRLAAGDCALDETSAGRSDRTASASEAGRATRSEAAADRERCGRRLVQHRLDELGRPLYKASHGDYTVDVRTAWDAFSEPVSLELSELSWPESGQAESGDEGIETLTERQTDALKQQGVFDINSLAVDIRFVNERGREVEPKGGAQVRMAIDADVLREMNVKPDSLKIIHLKETDGEDGAVQVEDVASAELLDERKGSIRAIKGQQEVELTEVTETVAAAQTETEVEAREARAVGSEAVVDTGHRRVRRAALDEMVQQETAAAQPAGFDFEPKSIEDAENIEATSGKQHVDSETRLNEDAEAVIADFSADSFSAFLLTWQPYEGEDPAFYLRVLFIDENGREIPGDVVRNRRYPTLEQPGRNGRRDILVSDIAPILLDTNRDGINDYRLLYDNDKMPRAYIMEDPNYGTNYQHIDVDRFQPNSTTFRRLRYFNFFVGGYDRGVDERSVNEGGSHVFSTYGYQDRNRRKQPTLYVVYRKYERPPIIETKDTAKDIRISIRDYNADLDAKNLEAGINRGRNFKFNMGNGGGADPRINSYHDGANVGIVKSNLGADGYPVLNVDNTSLAYLFGREEGDNGKISFAADNLNHLFYDGGQNYLVYDSADHFATLQRGQMEIFNKGFASRRDFNVYDIPLTYSIRAAQFQPFADIDSYGDLSTSLSNLWFGMKIEANVIQPPGGMAPGETAQDPDQNMVFRFSGDDDLWVFIDDKLILDLGGIHAKIDGSIDFATGEITAAGQSQGTIAQRVRRAAREANPGSNPTDAELGLSGNTFADYSNHKMRIFYFERGAGLSNMRVQMNLVTLPNDELYLGKKVINDNNINLPDGLKYNFRVELKRRGSTSYEPYTGPYQVWQGQVGNPKDPENVKLRDVSAEDNTDGIVALADGQYIKISGEGARLNPEDKYRITEFTEGTQARYSDMYDVTANVSTVYASSFETLENGEREVHYGDQISEKKVGDAPLVIFTNEVQARNRGYLVIDKEMQDGQTPPDPNQSFNFDVSVGGTAYSGAYELYDAAESDYTVPKTNKLQMRNGKLSLKAGQKAVIRDILWDTGYTVKEDVSGLSSAYGIPEHYRSISYQTVTHAANGTSTANTVAVENETHLTPKPEGEDETENGLKRDGTVVGKIPLGKSGRVIVKIENQLNVDIPQTGLRRDITGALILTVAAGSLILLLIWEKKRYRY